MTALSHLSPPEADTLLLERLRKRHAAKSNLAAAIDRILWCHAERRHCRVGNRTETVFVHPDSPELPLVVPFDVAVQHRVSHRDLIAMHEDGRLPEASRDIVSYREAEAVFDAANRDVREVDDEYKSRPWTRYWLVTTSDGHIHRSCDCSTCNKGKLPTGFAIVPSLSGKTSEEAVAKLGPSLCSVCYPDAPVESREQARISARLAVFLADDGEAAFEQAKVDAEARRRPQCEGSEQAGEPETVSFYKHRGYARCGVCRRRFKLRRDGVIPKHPRPGGS